MKKYVSGKINGLSEEEYHDAFERGCELVASKGDEPLSPLSIQACWTEDCNGFQGVDNRLSGGKYFHAWSCYLKHDIIAMLKCEGIVMLPNWTTSRGGKFEKYVAEQCDMRVEFISHDYKEIRDYA